MVNELMKEYDVSLDDIRWYLSYLMAFKFLEYKEQVHALTRYVWSGKLEKDLYNMEEIFLAGLKDDYERRLIDEGHLRGVFTEILQEKSKRRKADRWT
jgi:hypothetical protein